MSHSEKDVRVVLDLIIACKPLAEIEVIDPNAPDNAIGMISMGTYRSIKAAYEAAINHFDIEEKP